MTGSRTILVTGANSDIGIEVCRQSIDAGNKVIALFHNGYSQLDELQMVASDRLERIQIDFSDPLNIENFIKDHGDLLDEIDVFISLAALRYDVAYGEIGSADLSSHFAVNVIPVVLLVQYLGSSMMRKGWGRIVIGSSIGVKFGGGNSTYCYSLTKYASELIPKAAKRWSECGVLTNTVRIGVTDTKTLNKIGSDRLCMRKELIPMKRLADPIEVGKAICWLASEGNTYISGQVIAISGGE